MQLSLILFSFAMALYAGATVLYAYFFLNKNRTLSWYATFLTGAGFIMHTSAIATRWIQSGNPPLEGLFDSLSTTAWALVLVYFIVEHLVRVKVFGTLLVPVAVLLMAAAWLNFSPPGEQVSTVVDSWSIGLHVGLIVLANAGFAICGAASVVYLVQEGQLKSHRTSVFFRRLPSLAQTDSIARRAVAYAFPAYSASLLLGVLRAVKYAQDWYFDPRVMLAGVVWVIYGVYLWLRFRTSVSGRGAAWLAIFGFVMVVILGVLARLGVGDFHNFGGLG